MKISLAQISVIPGDTQANTIKMLFYVSKAKEAGADIIVFPEMSDTGSLWDCCNKWFFYD